jgi:glycosyltransferase involved in cell wall biosynthesis
VDAPKPARRRRRAPLIVFAGRVTGQKGPEQFVRAAALVAAERPDARFVLAGAGDRLEAVRREAGVLRLAQRMRFPGFLPRRELDRLLARADVLVMPSRSEPFGLIALEALARGTPAIVSRSSGVAEVVPRVLRADFVDAEELAAKIAALLALPRLRESQLASGAEALRALTWRAAGARLAAVYAELVGPAPAAPASGTIPPEP